MEILKFGKEITCLTEDMVEDYKEDCRVLDLSECTNLRVIPDRLFLMWKNLEEVRLPEGLEKIEDFAFSMDTSLSKINLPDSIKEIGEQALCDIAVSKIKLPESIKKIGDGAFDDTAVEILELPASIEKIGRLGSLNNLRLLDMSKCVHIKKIPAKFLYRGDMRRLIILPPNLEEIEDMAFQFINYLIVPASVRRIKSLEQVGLICLSENIESLRGMKGCVLNIPERMVDKYKRLIKKEGLSENNVSIHELFDGWTYWYAE